MRVSVSSLEKYERCPRQYYLEIIKKTRGAPEAPTRLGRVVHRTIETILQQHDAPKPFDADFAHERFVEEWAKESGLNSPQLFTEGLQMVHDWMNRWEMLDPKQILEIEKKFSIDFKSFTLVGVIDLVLAWDDINKDTGEITRYLNVFDWKTQNAFMSTRDAQESFQLAVYDIAARTLWPADSYWTTIELLRDGTRLAVDHSKEQLSIIQSYIEATVEKISLEDTWAAILNAECIYCAHKHSCEEHREALRVNNVPYCQDMHELDLLAVEREQLSIRRKIINDRMDKIDDALKVHISATSEPLNLVGHFFKISRRKKKFYPPEVVVPMLVKKLGVDARKLLSEISSINSKKLDEFLNKNVSEFGMEEIRKIQSAIEKKSTTNVTSSLYHRKEKKKK